MYTRTIKMKVLVTDPLDDHATQQMEKVGLKVTVKLGMSPAALKELIPTYHILAVRSGTKVTKDILQAATNLKLIVRAGIGLDNIDVDAALAKKIQIENTPYATTVSVAEHTIGLLFALARKIPQAHNSVIKGEWNRRAFEGVELRGKTLGIVGLGRIGQEVAKRAKWLGMNVCAHDHTVNYELVETLEIAVYDLHELLRKSDFVAIHLPLTPKTSHMFDHPTLKIMKKGSYLINAARGGIVDEQAVAGLIREGHLAGAAFDVYEVEPPGPNHPLFGLPNVICVPHIGAYTFEGQARAGQETARLIVEFAKKSH